MSHQTTTFRDVAVAEWILAVTTARDTGFDYFDWLTAVDQTDGYGGADPGYEIVVHLARIDGDPGLGRWEGALVRTRVPLGAVLPSLTGVFAGAAWYEREVAEMFGLEIADFDDGSGLGIRPLLLPVGFEGHPLRKSFVLTARASKPWPGAKEPGEGHEAGPSTRRRVQAPGVPDAEWGPRTEPVNGEGA